jgi:surface polysaccharide O-acyltransferase-like enzyme
LISVHPQSHTKDERLLVVVALGFLLGMVVSLAVYFSWSLRLVPPDWQSFFSTGALVVCPPFLLSYVLGATTSSDVALVLTVGTIIFANAFLYAGVAAGLYFVVTALMRRKS